jgi:hypothetical protein
MEEKVIKKESKFVDNVAYKNKFQFLIWVNDNVICQRYFKINGFVEDSIHTQEFTDCMNSIVRSIQEDLESKSRVFMWYTNMKEPFKMEGFLSNSEIEKYHDDEDNDFLRVMFCSDIEGDIEAPDGKIFHKKYLKYPENVINDFGDVERPADGEFVFKFSFLIDNEVVFERIWDGNVYPKFVRNGVDLANTYSNAKREEISSMSFGAAVVRYMQMGKTNLISEFIHRICETLSNSYTEKYHYTKELVIGDKKYNYLSNYENYWRSWREATFKKTRKYLDELYPSARQIEYIDKHY